MTDRDVAIIGGGIIGLATAYQLSRRFPRQRLVVLEKEPQLAAHQTGRNSGVLHSGIYYKPGTLKARNCRAGKQAMEAFCREQGIAHEICGKVIVAVESWELPLLERIFERGQANGVRSELIDGSRLREIEPHVAGMRAIHVPEAGIVSFRAVCRRLGELVEQQGGQVLTRAAVTGIERRSSELVLHTAAGTLTSRYLVNCAGLYSDHVVRLCGERPAVKVVPFRGEYYELADDARGLCRTLIYPVPDPAFPFLGVHFTRMIDGTVECGPNAVLALAREGYSWKNVRLGELAESLAYGGFLRLSRRYWRLGMGEIWRSLSKAAFVRALQRLIPDVQPHQLLPGRSGVRAQAVTPDGELFDDFLIQASDRVVHVANAPSPGATSALNIGNLVVDQLSDVAGGQL